MEPDAPGPGGPDHATGTRPDAGELRDRIAHLGPLDAHRLRRRLEELTDPSRSRRPKGRRRRGATGEAPATGGATREPATAGRNGPDDTDARLGALAAAVAGAEARLAARAASVPAIRYPGELPITGRLDDIRAALEAHQVVIVAGETGSGKSTQLPKLALDLGRGVGGLIGHTQPRRLAARAIAARVAEELGTRPGDLVGHTVRFADTVSERTLVKVMTDGILLAETRSDRLLRRYDTIIVDEAHERSLTIDFLLGYLHRILPRRPDLKLVITSATIDTARFAEHFGGAPVVEVSGRSWPVEVRWRPFGAEVGDGRDQPQAIADAVAEAVRTGPGDVLVFCSGEREIADAATALRRADGLGEIEILPLYARLSTAEQQRVFAPHTTRRVVLATNVAETSITVPGVRFVVDAGTARISRYSRRLKVQRLPIEPVSQASAAQRAGRCGRLGPGVAIRLYGEEDFAERPAFTEPEILRTNLASVLLTMADLDLGDVAAFPFLDPPDARAVADGVALLEELGAFEPGTGASGRPRLTPVGRRLARLPVDPRLGRMILEAERHGCVREAVIIAAALSIQDPRERPADAAGEADALHARFAGDSDFLSLLHLWRYLRELGRELSGNQFRKRCRAEHLHVLRIREWQDLTSQLRQVVADLGLHAATTPATPEAVHRALLAGLVSQVGLRQGTGREYQGARNARFVLAPSSVLAKNPPRWVMAAELVETNRLWARVAAAVQPGWIEDAAGHLVRRTLRDPRWDAERGEAVATERATLYGLPVVAGRTVALRRVDHDAARALFLRHGLLEGDCAEPAVTEVAARNARRLDAVAALEDRTRRAGLLAADEARLAFYDARIDASVADARSFAAWWRRTRGRQPDLLDWDRPALFAPGAVVPAAEDFPTRWPAAGPGEQPWDLRYAFAPGDPEDGVSVLVPLGALGTLDPAPFTWQVPGHRRDLVDALLRAVPKVVRRHLTPLGEHVDGFLTDPATDAARADGTSLPDALTAYLARHSPEPVPPGAVDLTAVPGWLRIRFVVVDPDGRALAAGRDVDALRTHLAGHVRAVLAASAPGLERTGLVDWTIGDLPATVGPDEALRGWPTLVDEGSTAGVRIVTSPEAQAHLHAGGLRRLLACTVPVARAPLVRAANRDGGGALAWVGGADALVDDVVRAALDGIVRDAGTVRTEDAFRDLQATARARLAPTAADLVSRAARLVARAADLDADVADLHAPALGPSADDMARQLARLIHPGFVAASGAARLDDLDRYLAALARRLERLRADPGRDAARMAPILALEAAVDDLLAADDLEARRRARELFWLVQELRVQRFAEVLGTAEPVSEQRIRRALDAARP